MLPRVALIVAGLISRHTWTIVVIAHEHGNDFTDTTLQPACSDVQ
jgi:hypothetical protein